MSNEQKAHAERLAKALRDGGVKSDEAAPSPAILALNAAQNAYLATGEGSPREWREHLDLRRNSEILRKDSNYKLLALCSRALEHPDLPEKFREDVIFAKGYFSGITEIQTR